MGKVERLVQSIKRLRKQELEELLRRLQQDFGLPLDMSGKPVKPKSPVPSLSGSQTVEVGSPKKPALDAVSPDIRREGYGKISEREV